MITAIREVRRAKGLTLADVGERCDPPTTAQTIGRLETGTRTVSVGWLNRIAKALGVEASDLVKLPERADLPVVALLSADGAIAPRHETIAALPTPSEGAVAVLVDVSVGDYRAGDEIWCERAGPGANGVCDRTGDLGRAVAAGSVVDFVAMACACARAREVFGKLVIRF